MFLCLIVYLVNSFHQKIWLKFNEEATKALHLQHRFYDAETWNLRKVQSPPNKTCTHTSHLHTLTLENSMLYVSTEFNYTSQVEYKLQ
jgi:hypothetical protein